MRTDRYLVLAAVIAACSAPAVARPPQEPLNEPVPARVVEYRKIGRAAAEKNGIPFAIVDAVMRVESAYNPRARGDAGEVGLMQIMPPTAALMGFAGPLTELAKPEVNIAYGTQYLAEAWRLANKDICTTVMKYRAGHGESRFSTRSVNYCRSVRAHLGSVGFPVTGSVPKATFGFAQASAPIKVGGRVRLRLSSGGGGCFMRVVQPGRRFGACISRTLLRQKGLLK
jgi:soluble lytic murein transglycosylase-like protein